MRRSTSCVRPCTEPSVRPPTSANGLPCCGVVLSVVGCVVIAGLSIRPYVTPPPSQFLELLDTFDVWWLGLYAFVFFTCGALALLHRRATPIALIAVTLLMVLAYPIGTLAFVLSAPFVGIWTVWIGRTVHLDRYLKRIGDLSYGVYIYGFPIQRLAVTAFEGEPNVFWLSYAVAMPATFIAALLSWRLVERPVLSRKDAVAARLTGWRARRSASGSAPWSQQETR